MISIAIIIMMVMVVVVIMMMKHVLFHCLLGYSFPFGPLQNLELFLICKFGRS